MDKPEPSRILTDTGERKAIAEQAANAVLEQMEDVVSGALKSANQQGREETKPASSVVSSDTLKAVVLERCEKCQQPGGANYELAHEMKTEMKSLSQEVRNAVRILDERSGEKRVWGIIRLIMVPVCCALLAWYLGGKSDTHFQKQIDVAAEVAHQLKVVQDATEKSRVQFSPSVLQKTP